MERRCLAVGLVQPPALKISPITLRTVRTEDPGEVRTEDPGEVRAGTVRFADDPTTITITITITITTTTTTTRSLTHL